MQGKIQSFNPDKGWGFIKPDGGEDNVMLHVRELARGEQADLLRSGLRVEFDVIRTPRGLRATNARVVQAAQQEALGFRTEIGLVLLDAQSQIEEIARRYGVSG